MFINKSSKDKKLKNNILALASDAANAKKIDKSVINSTSGIFKNEDGVLYEFDCVAKALKDLNVTEKFAYSNSEGTPAFRKAVLYSVFGKFVDDIEKECFMEAVPTPGGTGALNLAFINYVNQGETVLLPNHMWENYLNMGKDAGFNTDTYRLFNDEGLFDIDDLNSKIDGLKKSQKRIMMLINDPCENPTGFCMKDEDYDNLINIAKNNPNNDFIYLMDIAYFDFYNVNPDIIRSRFAKFKNIPSNALALFVYSGSKSFGLYGLRIGALIGLSKDENEINMFKDASSYTSRAKWSCASTLGINLIERLVLHDAYRFDYEEEVKLVCSMLEARSKAFLESAKKVGLKTLPYEKGFFICVPCDKPNEVLNALHEDKVHLVSTKSCLRVALCAISKEEAAKLPALIKARLN